MTPQNNRQVDEPPVFDMTFDEQKKLENLAYFASKPGSNQNKARFEMFAYVNTLKAQWEREARIQELRRIDRPELLEIGGIHYVLTRLAQLTNTKEPANLTKPDTAKE